jgi:acyl-CoA synthetase (AMP-forming)/AMP-acid ligase II
MSDTKNSGHRIGTAEVESALVSHPKCAEAAVVGIDHEVWFKFFFPILFSISPDVDFLVLSIS